MSLFSSVRERQLVKVTTRLLANVTSTMSNRQIVEFATLMEMKSAAEIRETLLSVAAPEARRLFLAIITSLPPGWTADRAGPALLGMIASSVRNGTTISEEDARASLTEAGADPSMIDQLLGALPRTADGAIEWATLAYAAGEIITVMVAPEFEALALILGGAGLVGGALTDEDSPLVSTRPRLTAPALTRDASASDDSSLLGD